MATKKKTTKTKVPPTATYGITGDYTGYEAPSAPAPAQQVEENVFVPGYTTLPGVNPPVTPETVKVEADTKAKTGEKTGSVGGYTGAKTFTASDGAVFTDENAFATYQASLNAQASERAVKEQERLLLDQQAQRERKSAFDMLFEQFNRYGLGSLVEPLRGLITDGSVSPSEFTLKLRSTDAYQKRFAANSARIQKGLTALSEGEYLALEDQYQNLMRNYGLPSTYYQKDDLGVQANLNKLIANDVSATELEERIATAQQRVLNSNPEVLQALRQFYPDISNADILAYTLDPENALSNIKRKVTAAEIGGAALAAGLQAQGATAEALAGYGVTKQQAQQGYGAIGEMLPRGSQLASIYKEDPYTQAVAEAEVFGTPGSVEATKKRKKLQALESSSFSGSSGVGALGRERPSYQSQTYGAGSY